MNELNKTIAFVVVAAALAGSALWASIPRSASVEAFDDQGQVFFPDFKDPADCTTLEVVEVDAATASPRLFKVTFKDNAWLIPSHDDYPADAADRLAQTAARVIGLKKDTIRSSRTEEHRSLGVLDPLENKSGSVDGVGKRITLRDKSDRVLAEYIIGKEVPGRAGQKFVRRPGQARTYGVSLQAEPSTRFADWIEPNLLKLQASQVRAATFVNDKADLAQGRIVKGENLTIDRKDASAPWTLPGLPADQEVDPAKTSAMLTALSDLKIVGVRRKPQGLADVLKGEGGRALDATARLSLQNRGFYLLNGRLYSDEGALLISCDDGVSYVLQFGKVTFAQGEALSAGTGEDDPKAKGEDAKKEETKGDGTVESRYLFVQAQFDPDAIPKPKAVADVAAGSLPESVFQKDASEIKAEADRAAREKSDYEAKVEAGRKRSAELAARFAPWYYVVPGDAYRSLVLDRKALVHAKPAPGSSPPPGGNPFGGGGLPPGLRGMMPQGHP